MRQAFDAAWAVIRKQELRGALNEKLVGVAAEGITDAEQLHVALQRMPLIPRLGLRFGAMQIHASQFLASLPAFNWRGIFALNNFLDPSARAARLMLHLG